MNSEIIYGKTIVEVWKERVAASPDVIFLADEKNPQGYTIAQTDELSGRVYAYLKKKGIGREDFVLICVPRGAAVFIAALGVLKSGAAFTIMEDHYPRERIEYIKKDSGSKLEINAGVWEEMMAEKALDGYEKPGLHDAAFAVYTSGSTGNPKGVLHEYGNINRMMYSLNFMRDCDYPTKFALIAPLNFVASLIAFFSVMNGVVDGIIVVPYSIVKNPIKLYELIAINQVTHIFLSPSYLRLTHCLKGSAVKYILTGSEAANGIYSPDIPILNVYCMSESGFAITSFFIDKPYDNCPVGKPDGITHEVMLIDEEGNTVTKPGQTGEICFDNIYCRGYIGLEKETAAAFKNGVFHSCDLGRYDENGNIVYMGRMNDMIKINGNRIEPAEIEAVGKKVLGVSWCAAKGFVTNTRSYICLYYKENVDLSEEKMRAGMEEKLPYYMIPSYFMQIDQIPMLPTGKFDRKSLPAPVIEQADRIYNPPATELEALICNTFAKVLGLERVGVDEDFFSLGGDSIKSMEVITSINSDYLTANELFKGRTAQKIALLYLENEKNSLSQAGTDDAVFRQNSYPLTEVQKKYLDEMLREEGKLGAVLARLFSFPVFADARKICDSVNQMINNRPEFGTVFFRDENGLVKQKYCEDKLPRVSVEKMSEAEFDRIKYDLLKPFAPFDSPFGIARVFETEKNIYLLIAMSHAMSDGSGERIYLNDVIKAYLGRELTQDTFYTYLEKNKKLSLSDSYEKAKAYYDKKYGNTEWLRCLPSDADGDDHDRIFYKSELSFTQAQITEAVRKFGISNNVLFASAVLIAAAWFTSRNAVLMNWTFQNRTEKIFERAAGILMKRLPLGIVIDTDTTLADVFAEIKEQIIDGISNSAYEWVSLTENCLDNETMSFVYQPEGMVDSKEISSLGAQLVRNVLPNPGTARKCAFMVYEYAGRTFGTVNYMKGKYSEEYISSFYSSFEKVLSEIIDTDDAEKELLIK